ncbi:hypothetical protein AaE_002219, partial [Aphanomyces astaci]
MEDDEDDMDDDGHGDGNNDGNDYASEQDECHVEMNEVPLPASRHEHPSRSGMGESEP